MSERGADALDFRHLTWSSSLTSSCVASLLPAGLPSRHTQQSSLLSLPLMPLNAADCQTSQANSLLDILSQPVLCALLSFTSTCKPPSSLSLQKCSLSEARHHHYPPFPNTRGPVNGPMDTVSSYPVWRRGVISDAPSLNRSITDQLPLY